MKYHDNMILITGTSPLSLPMPCPRADQQILYETSLLLLQGVILEHMILQGLWIFTSTSVSIHLN